MKKIIDGKRYDTKTAKLLCKNKYGLPGNFEYYWEGLYRKKTGEYFLAGEGGPMSPYGEQTGTNSWSGGEEIIPLSREEAMKFAEKHMDADKFEEEFGPIEEEKDPTLINLGNKIRKIREAAGLTQAEAAARAGFLQQVWAQYENAQVSPTVGRLKQIADALGVKPSELLEE